VVDIEPVGPAKMIKSDDGAEMLLVSAGEFTMGADQYDDEKPIHRVYLDAFYIDKYETTNTLYERFMRATGRSEPTYWTDTAFNASSQPVVGVSWHDADLYCKWAGKRLASEAEWEKAARGTDGREYPWGALWDASRANSGQSKVGKPTPVGSYPSGVSPYGAHDMAGNVWERVADWYANDYYSRSPNRNPTGPDAGTRRVLRGASWGGIVFGPRTMLRYDYPPDSQNAIIGFRCAKGAAQR